MKKTILLSDTLMLQSWLYIHGKIYLFDSGTFILEYAFFNDFYMPDWIQLEYCKN